MLEDRVLFHVGGESWTLSSTSLVLGLALIVFGGILLALLLARHGQRRRLVGRDASGIAFNAEKLGELRTIHGPARGVEIRVRFTIGDLRRARQAGDSLVFWGVPAMLTTLCSGFCLVSLWGALVMGEAMLLSGYVLLIPMFLIACFMPWAAVYTELE